MGTEETAKLHVFFHFPLEEWIWSSYSQTTKNEGEVKSNIEIVGCLADKGLCTQTIILRDMDKCIKSQVCNSKALMLKVTLPWCQKEGKILVLEDEMEAQKGTV